MTLDPNKRVNFVRASEVPEQQLPSTSYGFRSSLTGEEARQFYEGLFSDEQHSAGHSASSKSKSSSARSYKLYGMKAKEKREKSLPLTERDCRLFLKAAAEGDLQTVKNYCKRGIDIEVEDMFRWTALMCASAGGSESVTDYLLRCGANLDQMDSSGRTTTSLAQSNGHSRVLDIIEKHRRENDEIKLVDSMDKCKLDRGYCSTCQLYYAGDKHDASMVHMINSGQLPAEGYAYGIAQSNKGYRMLKNSGWSEKFGLGKEREGRKYPIKTILKRDHKGLGMPGSEKLKKVTHFEPYDLRAIESAKSPQMKRGQYFKALAEKKRKEQRMEIEFRRMFNE